MQDFGVDFRGANRQFSFLRVSSVYDKSNPHKTIYDSYNTKLASTSTNIQSLKVENASNNYSPSNKLKFDVSDKHGKYLLYCQFVAWKCNRCRVVPLKDYANNEIFQQLPNLKDHFTNSDEK